MLLGVERNPAGIADARRNAELMAEHPDTKYIVNTNDPDFWGDLAMSVLPTIALIAITVSYTHLDVYKRQA